MNRKRKNNEERKERQKKEREIEIRRERSGEIYKGREREQERDTTEIVREREERNVERMEHSERERHHGFSGNLMMEEGGSTMCVGLAGRS